MLRIEFVFGRLEVTNAQATWLAQKRLYVRSRGDRYHAYEIQQTKDDNFFTIIE